MENDQSERRVRFWMVALVSSLFLCLYILENGVGT